MAVVGYPWYCDVEIKSDGRDWGEVKERAYEPSRSDDEVKTSVICRKYEDQMRLNTTGLMVSQKCPRDVGKVIEWNAVFGDA